MHRGFVILIICLLTTGAFLRLAPLLETERLLQSVSEDGYLMLTIARNIAIGNGMSTADGEIMTNGTQPLTTLLWAGIFWLNDGDKVMSIAWITITQFIIITFAAFLLWRLGLFVLQHRPHRDYIAALAAATWYASPMNLQHSMNGLETGLYALAIIAVAWLVIAVLHWSWRYTLMLGLVLGISFWIRNDAAFLIFAVCVVYWLAGSREQSHWQRFAKVIVLGITTIIVALPWLIYNQYQFGSIIPISGTSQSMSADFADNLHLIPTIVTEYLLTFLPMPGSLQSQWWMIAGSSLLLLAVLALLFLRWRFWYPQERRLLLVGSLFIVTLSGFYGLYFGAAYFLPRYFFPFSGLLALLWAVGVAWLWQRSWLVMRWLAIVGFIVIIGGLAGRSYLRQTVHLHFQVVNWVEKNVPEQAWVGAIQSGTVGYFHDRTLNLDGKVNPDALAARKQHRLLEYIVDSQIDYMADWAGIANWVNPDNDNISAERQSMFKQHFQLIVDDKQSNLAVFQRKKPRLDE